MPRTVKIYRSHPKGLKVGNFGDELTIPLLERLFGVSAVPVAMHDAELLAVGSILDSYSRARWPRRVLTRIFRLRPSDLHVWGSGFMLEDSTANWPANLFVHAVRGVLTANRLSQFDGPIGDPGILASQIVSRPRPTASVALVPHFVDEEHVRTLALPEHWKVVNPDNEALPTVKEIASAELVVSSSLHGLIVADSFGIPAIWARSVNDLYKRSDFKFHDHASARDEPFNAPTSYSELISKPLTELHKIATRARRDLDQWQDALIKSFPFA
ncbi:polysaccharide pyruvyl transferase family protein [Chelativorans sp. YIM 93263]|uniref:polysaccharide pyruvyl transferase family protein n=1 Tax=Chelativorans sp. YIM 93263 TaxID=2906648 RepID=UPI0023798C2A|nr:polysaccharide pyruvyl transferase family protein [Chelativorans sp. YIM 93263]